MIFFENSEKPIDKCKEKVYNTGCRAKETQ